MPTKKQVVLSLLLLGLLYKLYLEYKRSKKHKINTKQNTYKNTKNLKFALAFHGGAGTISPNGKYIKQFWKSLEIILKQSYQLCLGAERNNLSAVDIACKVVMLLENDPIFNAGKGSIFTRNRTHELGASIMDGKTLQSGSVGLLKTIKNPILLAKDVMYNTPHSMLFGKGAELYGSNKLNDFKAKYKHEIVENSYFDSQRRGKSSKDANKNSFGTVGCVVMLNGNVAAATSTGGMSGKMLGRIGDTSCFDCHNRMLYNNNNIKECMNNHILDNFPPNTGGFIGVDKYGNIGINMNTNGLLRGYLQSDNMNGKIAIWNEQINIKMD